MASVRLDQLSKVIDEIYASIEASERWDGALESLRVLTHSTHAVVQVNGKRPGIGWLEYSAGVDPHFGELYTTTYGAQNPWIAIAPKRFLSGDVIDGAELVPLAELRDTEFYNGFMKPQALVHTLGCLFDHSEDLIASVAVARGERAYEAEDVELLRCLHPHMQRALRTGMLARQAAGVAGVLAERLDRQAVAVLTVARDGSPTAWNERGSHLLADVGGAPYVDGHGQMRAADRDCDRQLTAALRGIFTGDLPGTGAQMCVPAEERPPLLLDISVAPPTFVESLGRVALVLVREARAATRIDAQLLRKAFRLTAAEAEIASLIADGRSTRQIASEIGVSIETVRSHTKRVLAKTNTSRQAELCLLLAKFC